MTTTLTYRDRFRRFVYFFPFRLILLHFKKNHLLLLCWLILFGYVFQALSATYGIPYLILAPEYFGEIGFISFFITGMALGGFITAFNLYSYALHAFRFPFIATVARPFAKFSINNGIIPITFLAAYIYSSINVQSNHELISSGTVFVNILGFISGVALFIALSYLYFTRTNTDIIKILGSNVLPPEHTPSKEGGESSKKWFKSKKEDRKWHVETYLAKPYRIALARSSSHYEPEVLNSILWQNHINGSLFEVLLVLSFLSLGAFGSLEVFNIPAGASIFMLFTTLLMLISAVFSWFKGWTLTVLIALFVLANQVSVINEDFFYESRAYGLDYNAAHPIYNASQLNALANDTVRYELDKVYTERILERWKSKNSVFAAQDYKPRMVLIAVSGGGSRSMLWTYRSLQYADSILDGNLMDQTALITGSSGGLIGASYYRELFRQQSNGLPVDRFDEQHLHAVSEDILNPVGFSLVTNDLFIRYRKITDGEKVYRRDRGFAFENELNNNLNHALDVRLKDLVKDEQEARIPLLMITPSSTNDGRRLLISTQPASYMADNIRATGVADNTISSTIEYSRFFSENDPMELKLTSALRMSATFPYIMPLVSLPSEPAIQVMDAGVRDNFGMITCMEFIHEFRGWITENTSGVVILQIRDRHKDRAIDDKGSSLITRFYRPVQNVTGNMLRVQDMAQDELFDQVSGGTDFPLERVVIELRHDHAENISLSWHLTAFEKVKVLEQVDSEENLEHFARLVQLMKKDSAPTLLTSHAGDNAAALRSGLAQ